MAARVLLATGMALFLTAVAPAGAGDEFGPWSADPRHPVIGEDKHKVDVPRRLSVGPFTMAFGLWSKLLTRIDGPRCAHTPSCAAFAKIALQRHGAFPGLWMALNRVMRGARSSALRLLPLVRVHDRMLFSDPVDDNAFWKR